MPRKRMVKPEFWTDPKILALKRDLRLFFIGIWNFADDTGIIENNSISLKVKIFPGDEDIKLKDIDKWVDEIVSQELLIKGRDLKEHKLLKVTNWDKHQKISHPTASEYVFEPIIEESKESSLNTQEKLSEESLLDKYSIVEDSIVKISKEVKENTFDHFYSIYPRKVKKKTAERAFNKLSKKDKELAFKGIERYNLYWLNNNVAKDYIPHPASWLNARQWEDEINTNKPIVEGKDELDRQITRRHQNTIEQSTKLKHYLKEAEDKADSIPNLVDDLRKYRKESNAKPISEVIGSYMAKAKPDTSTDEQ